MFRNVVLKLIEARDISLHLQPLKQYLLVIVNTSLSFLINYDFNDQEMKKKEYSDLRQSFPVLLHLLCLIYSNSQAYAKPVRIITLMKVNTLFADL